MSEIDELERRIMAALERVGAGIDGLVNGAAAGEEGDLRQLLEDEKLASAQLEERVKHLSGKVRSLEEAAAEAAAGHEEAIEAARSEALAALDGELQGLREANRQLRENNQALRDANEAGVGEPHLINTSVLAELEALRAVQAADKAESEAVLAALDSAIGSAGAGASGDAGAGADANSQTEDL